MCVEITAEDAFKAGIAALQNAVKHGPAKK
jgi:hypothetical protein